MTDLRCWFQTFVINISKMSSTQLVSNIYVPFWYLWRFEIFPRVAWIGLRTRTSWTILWTRNRTWAFWAFWKAEFRACVIKIAILVTYREHFDFLFGFTRFSDIDDFPIIIFVNIKLEIIFFERIKINFQLIVVISYGGRTDSLWRNRRKFRSFTKDANFVERTQSYRTESVP